jgi:c-di-GMP phosphodiesterase
LKYSQTGRLVLPESIAGPVFLIGRQPILDRRKEVFGYELLHRPTKDNYVNITDAEADQATLSVFLNTFSQAGLQTLVGNRKAFLNVTRKFLTGFYPFPLPPEQVVLEVLEDTEVDAELILTLRSLSSRGYQIAMDDITSPIRIVQLLKIIRYAKIDIAAVDPADLPILVKFLKRSSVYLIAEKVETIEEYEMCSRMGFDYFQGFFFCRPEIVSGRKINTSRQVVLQTLAKLQDPDIQMSQVDRLISLDPTLGYRVLKLVNSSYYALSVEITSIRQAIVLIGLNHLKSWLSLLMMAKVNDKPNEINMVALFRARMSETIAIELKVANTDSFFLAGLFSVLDAVLDMPMQDIVEDIALSPDIVAALVNRKGKIGSILQAIQGIEHGNWDEILKLGLEAVVINAIFMEAVQWTERLVKEVF